MEKRMNKHEVLAECKSQLPSVRRDAQIALDDFCAVPCRGTQSRRDAACHALNELLCKIDRIESEIGHPPNRWHDGAAWIAAFSDFSG